MHHAYFTAIKDVPFFPPVPFFPLFLAGGDMCPSRHPSPTAFQFGHVVFSQHNQPAMLIFCNIRPKSRLMQSRGCVFFS